MFILFGFVARTEARYKFVVFVLGLLHNTEQGTGGNQTGNQPNRERDQTEHTLNMLNLSCTDSVILLKSVECQTESEQICEL